MTKTCLDLFCGLGGFSAAFEDAEDWRVVTVDIEEEFDPDIQADVMDLRPSDLPDADVVLASPPCVDFSVACICDKWQHDENRRPKHLPRKPQIAESVALVFRTLWLIEELQPEYWFLENPQGMLRKWIGNPLGQVHYCQYGSGFKKPTDLWGNHPLMRYKKCPGTNLCHHVSNPNEANNFRDGTRTTEAISYSAERAKVPYGFSEAILEAVEGRAEQKTLAIVDPADARDSGEADDAD